MDSSILVDRPVFYNISQVVLVFVTFLYIFYFLSFYHYIRLIVVLFLSFIVTLMVTLFVFMDLLVKFKE